MDDEGQADNLVTLLHSARRGDRGALNRLLHRLWPWLRKKAGFLASRTRSVGASSLTQETALRFSRSIRTTRATDAPAVKALLHRIMENTAYDAHRTAVRAKRDPARQFLAELETATHPDASAQIENEDRLHRLDAAILGLPDRQRQAIRLLLEDLPTEEIARRLYCSIGAVHMLIQRAKAQLAHSLSIQS